MASDVINQPADRRSGGEQPMKRRRWTGGASTPRVRAVLVLGALSLWAATGLTSAYFLAVRAGADPIGSCSTTSGVIVAVDFSHFGGNVERGCSATSASTTGYQALQNAGFASTGDEHDGPAFICRITNPATGISEPQPSEDPCITTPSRTAYWSYWHAGAGQNTWTYSSQGAMSYEPPPGSVDVWTFGAGNPPPFSPSEVQATNATAARGQGTSSVTPISPPTVPRVAAPATAVGPPNAVPAETGSRRTESAAPGGAHDATSATNSTPSSKPPTSVAAGTASVPGDGPGDTGSSISIGNPSAASRPARTTPRIVNVAPASGHRRTSSGSPIPFAIGGFVVVALAASGGAVAWRRRSASS